MKAFEVVPSSIKTVMKNELMIFINIYCDNLCRSLFSQTRSGKKLDLTSPLLILNQMIKFINVSLDIFIYCQGQSFALSMRCLMNNF